MNLRVPPSEETGPRKKVRCFRSKIDDIFLRLEEHIQLVESIDIADRVLVGRISGRHYTTKRLKAGVCEVWGHRLVELPTVQTFLRGWFSFRFARSDHTNSALSSYWNFDHASILVKRWSPLFDPESEQMGVGPLGEADRASPSFLVGIDLQANWEFSRFIYGLG